MAVSFGCWHQPCITWHARRVQPLRLAVSPLKGNCIRRPANQLQWHDQHASHVCAGVYDKQGSSSDSHDNKDNQQQGDDSSHGIPRESGTSTGQLAAVTWLGRGALLAAVVPICIWSITWVLDTGIMQLGYTCLWAMTQLGFALFGTSQKTFPTNAPADYTDLALRTAARLSHGGAAATQLAQDMPAGISFGLLALFHCWRAVQHAVLGIKLGLPWISTLPQLCVLCCTITFALTLTPLRPVIASVVGRVLQQPAQANSTGTQSQLSSHQGQQVGILQAVPAAALIESSMQAVGRLSLVVLMTTAQAAEVSAPPLSGGSLMFGSVPAAGGGGGPPPLASSLFAITAPLSDVLLPAALAGLAATAIWQALKPSSLATRDSESGNGSVSSHIAAVGLDGRLHAWHRVSVAVCALRAAMDAVWLVVIACGQAPGSVSVVRVVGSLMLARLAWRGARELNVK